jgi:hypothetical protein
MALRREAIFVVSFWSLVACEIFYSMHVFGHVEENILGQNRTN